MFPIGDSDIRNTEPPLITVGLIVLNLAAFIIELTFAQSGLREFLNQYGAVPARILRGEQMYTLITSIFLHGGWYHLISNMLFLWIFGDNVEAALGRIIYPIFYLCGGVAASAAHILLSPTSTLPMVGASGAIGAVLGAYVVMFPASRVRVVILLGYFMTVRRVTAVFFLGIWFVTQFFNGIASLGAQTAETGGVAVWAHVGGFLVGLLVGILCKQRAEELTLESEPPDRWHRRL